VSQDDATALEAAIAALTPDALSPGSLRDAETIALRLAAIPAVAALARAIARTLAACGTGEVEPHHAQWRMASAAWTLRQSLASGGAPSQLALDGARHDLETLLPRAQGSAQPPTLEDAVLVHPGTLKRT
jgi:hypothetical protein